MAIAVDTMNKQMKSCESRVDSLLIFILNLFCYMMHCKKGDQIHFLNTCQAT